MKTLTQNTSARITNPGSQADTGTLSSLIAQHVFKGKLQGFLEILRGRLFVFYKFAPIRVHSNKGGARPIWRDRHNMD
jgi:hypothetical protein